MKFDLIQLNIAQEYKIYIYTLNFVNFTEHKS